MTARVSRCPKTRLRKAAPCRSNPEIPFYCGNWIRLTVVLAIVLAADAG